MAIVTAVIRKVRTKAESKGRYIPLVLWVCLEIINCRCSNKLRLKGEIMKFTISRNLKAVVFFMLILTGTGCKEDSVTSGSDENLDFSSVGSTEMLDNTGNMLEIDNVKILLKDIKLNVSNSSDEVNFKTGPYVIFLNLNSSVNVITSAQIPAGIYDRVKFEIHKLNDNEVLPDPEFADANGRYSIVVKGWFNGNYFIYKSKKSAHQILSFPGMLRMTELKTNITLQVKPYIWFLSNGIFLDPEVSSNSNDIDNNIKDNINNNFKIFIDSNRDGMPDS